MFCNRITAWCYTLLGFLSLTALAPTAGAQSQAWIRQFGTPQFDTAESATPDGTGGFYVSGLTRGALAAPPAGQYDVWLGRFDATGTEIWIRQTAHQLNHRTVTASDGAGGVYFCGTGATSLGFGPWIARYDSAGNSSWISLMGAVSDQVTGVVSDGAGGAFVCGATWGSLGGPNAGDADAWFARYDGAGNRLWIRQLGSADEDSADGVASDGAGGVFVTGDSVGGLVGPPPSGNGLWLARYDALGNQTWILQDVTDVYTRAAVSDGAGGVYVCGSDWGGYGGPAVGAFETWLAHYDGAGN